MSFGVWVDAFATVLQPQMLIYIVLGSLFGLVVGALPGLGALFSIALMLPVTFYMDPLTAVIFLAAIHAATVYGDSWASALINTPGGVGSIATMWDGYPLAQQGKSGLAMGAITMASLLGGLIGWLSIVLVSPILTRAALAMGPWEYAMLGIFALSLVSLVSEGETLKGLILAGLGLMISFVGRDVITGTPRFTFGSLYLEDGFPLVAVSLGLFALSEAFILAEQGGTIARVRELSNDAIDGLRETLKRPFVVLRSGILGAAVGAVPGVGVSLANVLAYFVQKRLDPHPETYGKGNVSGVVAPEAANNACAVAEMLPTFTLGIPGGAPMAMLLSALLIHGVQVGPSLFRPGGMGYTIFAGVFMGQVAFFVLGLILVRWMSRIVLVPPTVLVPMIILLSSTGAFAYRYRLSDVILTIVFGVLGYVMKRHHWPTPCVVLGLVLGTIIEANFARAMLISDYDLTAFLTRPISLTLFIIIVLVLIVPPVVSFYRRMLRKAPTTPPTALPGL